ncbi:spherulation-specific family 4 protein [Streptomyces sp. DT24]|uniref:spherulation-specific family 4 protein n=1 Tax=unclassified Streptomyces TaxID=2593676 RepID=UPI0023B9C821|nr:spherulation-specific family 4 protein [Streptomyces sp. AM 4-1-1]WEH33509.1 spherulation-specific family 4 protein [Streptomyces sp. AM 4-1-1]
MTLLVPLYAHPVLDPDGWQELTGAAEQIYGVVLNPASGPGELRDPSFVAAARALREAGTRVLGYVDLDYGKRPDAEVTDDLARHRELYDTDGCFFDRAPSDTAGLRHCRSLVRVARRGGATTVVLNPGVHPAPGYARIADLIVTFEGHWTSYLSAFVRPRWTSRHPPERFCHLVYGVPPSLAPVAVRTARERGAAVCCPVPGELPNPWAAPPSALLGKTS